MRLERSNADGLRYVAHRMKPVDHEEVMAWLWTDGPEEVVDWIHGTGSDFWIAGTDQLPVTAIGYASLRPGVVNCWMFSTPDLPRIVRPLTKWVRGELTDILLRSNTHRAEAYSLSTHVEAHRWLEHLGAVREGTMRRAGKNEQDYFLYAWRQD